MEKVQAARVAQQLKSERGTDCESVVVVEDGHERDDLSQAEKVVFENYLPLAQKHVAPASEAPDDLTQELSQRSKIKLYRCSEEDATLKVTEVKDGPLEQKDLNSNVRSTRRFL